MSLIMVSFTFMPYFCVNLFKLSISAVNLSGYGTPVLCRQHISPYSLTHRQPWHQV